MWRDAVAKVESPEDTAAIAAGKQAALLERVRHLAHIRTPHPNQKIVIDCKAPRKIIRAGRRFGKTVGDSIEASEEFLNGRRVLYAAPTTDQVEAFWGEVSRAFAEPIAAGLLKKNETDHAIWLPGTEVRIRAKTAWNADTLRGDYADVLMLEEWQLMDENAWGEVGAPMLLDNNGRAVFIYTPPSLYSRSTTKARDPRHAAKMFKRAQADTSGRWATFTFTSHDNPTISKNALTDITLDMTQLAYRQEIMAEDVDAAPGALWTQAMIDAARVDSHPRLTRIVVGVDPPGGATECGIIAAGADINGHAYILADASIKASPAEWANKVLETYQATDADCVVAEKNYGGDMVASTILTAANTRGISVYCHLVNATRGKAIRAEPVVARFEQGRVHLVGEFPYLEEEMLMWVPGQTAASPNRVDACLIAGTIVLTDKGPIPIESIQAGMQAMTRKGLRRILAAGMTNNSAPVITVTFSDGRKLTGTANHPVFVKGKGFAPLNALVWDDIIEVWKEKQLPSTETSLSVIPTRPRENGVSTFALPLADMRRLACCIRSYGRRRMGQYPRATWFTILMGTPSIIPWRILNVLVPLIMPDFIADDAPNGCDRTLTAYAPWQQHGTGHPKDWTGIGSMGPILTRIGNRLNTLASNVGRSINPWDDAQRIDSALALASPGGMRPTGGTMRTGNVSSAARPSTSRNPRSSEPAPVYVRGLSDDGRASVYNLEVEDAHEYYANGILVHNCVWAITELMPLLNYSSFLPVSDVAVKDRPQDSEGVTIAGSSLAGYKESRWKPIMAGRKRR